MALTKLTTDLDNITALDNEPNDVTGLTAAQVKILFDKAGNDIKTYINSTLTTEIDVLPATSISVSPIATLTGTEVQTVLESIKATLDTISLTNVNVEVADTHLAADARTYSTLSERLDTIDSLDGTKATTASLAATNAALALTTTHANTVDSTTYKKLEWTNKTSTWVFPSGLELKWGTVLLGSQIATVAPFYYATANITYPIPFEHATNFFTASTSANVDCWISRCGYTGAAGGIICATGLTGQVGGRWCTWFAMGY